MGSRHQIVGGALIGYVAIAVNILAGLLYTPWMISVLGNSDYGLYTLASSLISIFMFDFGISAAVSRFVAREHVMGNVEGIHRILGTVYRLYFLIDLIITLILIFIFIFIDELYAGLTSEELDKLRIIFIIVGAYNIIVFPTTPFGGVLTAYEEFISLKLCDIFNKVFSIVCIVIALCMGGGLYALVLLTAISGLLTAGMKYIFVRRKTDAKADLLYKDKTLLKELLGFSIWTTIISLAQRLIFNITPSILGAVSNATAIAVFGVSSTIEGYVYMVANAMNGLFVARVANNSISGGEASRKANLDLMVRVGRIQFIIVGLIFAVFFSMGDQFVALWIGAEYHDSFIGAVFLLVPMLFSSSQQIAETMLLIENKVKQQSMIFAVMAVLNICLTIPLSSAYGAVGAALSISISYLVRTALMNVLYSRELKLNMGLFYKSCYTTLWIPIVAGIAVGVFLNIVISVTAWWSFIVKCLGMCAVYALLLYPVLNGYEKALIKRSIKRLSR